MKRKQIKKDEKKRKKDQRKMMKKKTPNPVNIKLGMDQNEMPQSYTEDQHNKDESFNKINQNESFNEINQTEAFNEINQTEAFNEINQTEAFNEINIDENNQMDDALRSHKRGVFVDIIIDLND